jgi:hypothetical protein
MCDFELGIRHNNLQLTYTVRKLHSG